MKVNGKLCYLWRAVDHEGEVLEAVVTAKRDKAAALKLLKRIMKKYGTSRSIVTDGLRAYSAAMNEMGVAADRHEVGGRLNNLIACGLSPRRSGSETTRGEYDASRGELATGDGAGPSAQVMRRKCGQAVPLNEAHSQPRDQRTHRAYRLP